MTDKDKVLALLDDLGIGHETKDDNRFGAVERIDCICGMFKVFGYEGYSISWYFDDDGKFLQVRTWS